MQPCTTLLNSMQPCTTLLNSMQLYPIKQKLSPYIWGGGGLVRIAYHHQPFRVNQERIAYQKGTDCVLEKNALCTRKERSVFQYTK